MSPNGTRPGLGPSGPPIRAVYEGAAKFISHRLCSFLTDKPDDHLLFCSDNYKDWGRFDQQSNAHVLHEDVRACFPCQVTYYRSLPELVEKEFGVALNVSELQDYEEVTESVKKAVAKQRELMLLEALRLEARAAELQHEIRAACLIAPGAT